MLLDTADKTRKLRAPSRSRRGGGMEVSTGRGFEGPRRILRFPKLSSSRRWSASSRIAVVGPLCRLGAIVACATVFFPGDWEAILLVSGVFFISVHRSFAVNYVALGTVTAAVTAAIVGLLASLLLTPWPIPGDLGLATLLETAVAVGVSVALIDYLLRTAIGGKRLLIVAAKDSALRLSDEVSHRRARDFDVVGVLDERDGRDDTICKAVVERRADVVVLPRRDRCPLVDSGIEVLELSAFFEQALSRLPPRLIASELTLESPRLHHRVVSRAFDLFVALIGLIVTGPLWLIVAVFALVKRRASLFQQTRVGKGGVVFTIYKFRTMRVDAESHGQAMWAQTCDPRVRTGGRVLRDAHLDELPQFWNVVKGDMAIVGPRPERPELVTSLEEAIPHWTGRQLVKPGITGLAQVLQGYARDTGGSEEKLSFDLWYVRHRTVLLDLGICVRTLPSLIPLRARTLPRFKNQRR